MIHIDLIIKDLIDSGSISTIPEKGEVYSHQGWKDTNRLLKGSITKFGYVNHCIRYNGMNVYIRAHRIIWISVYGLPDEALEIDHINRIKTDNRISNLRLVSREENAKNRKVWPAEFNSVRKLTPEQILDIRHRYSLGGISQSELANEYDMHQATISKIIRGKNWKHLPSDKVMFKQRSKLTEIQIAEIRMMIDIPLNIITNKYNISKSHACSIRKRKELKEHGN